MLTGILKLVLFFREIATFWFVFKDKRKCRNKISEIPNILQMVITEFTLWEKARRIGVLKTNMKYLFH